MNELVIGNVVVQDIVVEDVSGKSEEGGADVWLTATVTIWFELQGVSKPVTIISGCWQDTDNDHIAWSSDDEGERAIATYLGGGHTRAIRTLMPRAVEELGHLICAKIRQAWYLEELD